MLPCCDVVEKFDTNIQYSKVDGKLATMRSNVKGRLQNLLLTHQLRNERYMLSLVSTRAPEGREILANIKRHIKINLTVLTYH